MTLTREEVTKMVDRLHDALDDPATDNDAATFIEAAVRCLRGAVSTDPQAKHGFACTIRSRANDIIEKEV